MMKMTDKESFEGALDDWFGKWEDFLNELTTNIETGKLLHPQTPKECLQKS
jgi:hypothetical protein